MIIYCCACGKQAVNYEVDPNDKWVTTLIGAKSGFKDNECFCGYCAKDLDLNGNFPEELALCHD